MRYRSFGRSEVAVSTVTLNLQDTPGKARAADWRAVVFAGLENGINAFELAVDASPGVMNGLGEAISSLERRLCFITLRCPVSAEDLASGAVLHQVAQAAERVGVERFDCLMLEGEALETLSPSHLQSLSSLREIARYIGVAGGRRLDALASRGVIDAITVDYSLTSPVQERNRIRNLGDSGVAIIVAEACPEALLQPPHREQRRGLLGRKVHTPAGGYDFLHTTNGWTAEQICLAYVMTEPGVTTIRITASDPKRIASLAEVVDRDVPGGLGAQVEMARFTDKPAPQTLRRA